MDTNNLSHVLYIFIINIFVYTDWCISCISLYIFSIFWEEPRARKSVHVFGNDGFYLTSMIWEPANRAKTNGCPVADIALLLLYQSNIEGWEKVVVILNH